MPMRLGLYKTSFTILTSICSICCGFITNKRLSVSPPQFLHFLLPTQCHFLVTVEAITFLLQRYPNRLFGYLDISKNYTLKFKSSQSLWSKLGASTMYVNVSLKGNVLIKPLWRGLQTAKVLILTLRGHKSYLLLLKP